MTDLNVSNSTEKISVNNIYCIGRNYIDHIKEMQADESKSEIPEAPVVFLKPNTAIVLNDYECRIPEYNGEPISSSLQNEVELVIVIGKDGDNILEKDANEYIYGYAVGIDLTLRDIQTRLKSKGLPWTLSKGFRTSAPVSDVTKKESINDPQDLDISLTVNHEPRQKSKTFYMIFNVYYLVHYISCIFGLKKGDLIFTGTPAGVSDLKKGDIVVGEISKIGKIKVKII